ncbi:MAG: cation transporter [Hahellaceae bacterium]|nr:cation transporter [Hahellaceae bacterium]
MPDAINEKVKTLQRVTIIGMALDLALTVAKVVVGIFGNSYALIADGIHSLTDAASDIMVIALAHYAHQKPDSDHPYGHGKFETLGTVVLGSFLIAVAGAMVYDSFDRLLSGESDQVPSWPVLVVAAASILSKEWIYRYTLHYGKKYRSDLIIANAWHSRSDAFSSIIVFVAAAGAMMGYPWLDPIAAALVALMIAKIGGELAWKSAKELVETAVSDEELDNYRKTIESVEGVKDVHYLRGRNVGPDVVIDMHLQVTPKLSISEGHFIGLRASRRLRTDHEHIRDITFHMDAENDGGIDEQLQTYIPLPQRSEVINTLERCWQPWQLDFKVDRVTIHYLRGHLDLEILLTAATPLPDVEQRLRQGLSDVSWLRDLRVWVRPATQ